MKCPQKEAHAYCAYYGDKVKRCPAKCPGRKEPKE